MIRLIYSLNLEEGVNLDVYILCNIEQREKKGHSIEITLDVTLEELYLGKTVEIEINKQIICPICRGTGAKSEKHVKECSTCRGSGVQIIRQQFAPGIFQQMQTTCNSCGGKGRVVSEKCPHCKGHKVKRGSTQQTIYIEKGMNDGARIEFEGESDQSPDYSAGDLIFTLKQIPHPVFTREGMNLQMKHTITLKDALLGFETTVNHLDGEKLVLKRDSVTHNGF
jgi:DnaJ-related protein SCJ1